MHVHNDIKNIKINSPYITVGTFDGVHLGHQHIFNHLRDEAKKNNTESAVMTFWPHPRMILNNMKDKVKMINTIDEKIELIEKQGIEHLIILPFTHEFSQLSSREFIYQYLVKNLNIKGLIVGYDHRFGKDRQGKFEDLKQYAEEYGFSIKKIEAYTFNNEEISSTRIREALLDGQIEVANSFLSRKFGIWGHVTNGEKIGRILGFPTANIVPDSPYKLIPKDGVYAVKVYIEDLAYKGMLNIGIRPTINKQDKYKSIEVHIIDFDGNLYDKKIRIYFHKRMRNEMKFKSIEELQEQLKKDKIQIENYFR